MVDSGLKPHVWFAASVRNIADQGEMSAFGLPGVTGVLVLEVPSNSALERAGLKKNEVACVEGIGRWMAPNGEGIYATRPWKVYIVQQGSRGEPSYER